MYDISNIDMWKYKMIIYLKTLGMLVYLAITKKLYLDNNKWLRFSCTQNREYQNLKQDVQGFQF